jgi:hypothetical protein
MRGACFVAAKTLRDTEMLRIGFLTELIERRVPWSEVAAYLGRQLNAIAGGDRAATRSRSADEGSPNSALLNSRLASRRRC